MNLEQLHYIVEVAEKGTISGAAENLHVSHAAISKGIASIESELGFAVFDRSRSGSKCTEEGKAVVKIAHEIMHDLAELRDLGQRSARLKGDVKINASTIFFSTALPEAIYAYKKSYPQVKVEIYENDTLQVIDSIRNSTYDIGLIMGTDDTLKEGDPNILYQPLMQSRLMVCVSKHSSLAYNTVIGPEELLAQPLVIRNENFAKSFWNNLFDQYHSGDVMLYSNNHDVIRNLIANNLAAGVYTELWVKKDPLILSGDIVAIPYYDNGFLKVYLMSILLKNKRITAIMKEFLKTLENKLKEYIA